MTLAIDHRLEAERQAYLDALYQLDGRQDPAHPLHATYTGLMLQRQRQLLEQDRQLVLGQR